MNSTNKSLTQLEMAQIAQYRKNENEDLNIFDPFMKVDGEESTQNPLQISKRTLNGENNLISETFKIIHNMILGRKLKISQKTKINSQKFEKNMKELKDVDMRFLRDYIKTISADYGKRNLYITIGTQKDTIQNGMTLDSKNRKENEDLSTILIPSSASKMKPNYTASSFYNLRPVENLSKLPMGEDGKQSSVFNDTQY